MKKWKVVLVLVILVAALFSMTSCTVSNYVNIPAGYIGKILRPTGWDKEWLTAGQVNLGQKNQDGSYNQLVLLQVTSETYLEAFGPVGSFTDGQDHRILTQDGVPCEVNVTLRMMVSEDNDIRDAILTQVSPTSYGSAEVSYITMKDVYLKFAQAEVRSAIRGFMAKYENYGAIYKDYDNISKELGIKIAAIFNDVKIPLDLMQTSLSNVKPDASVSTANNQQAAASSQVQAIEDVGSAMARYPLYGEYMKWEYLLKIAQTGANITVVVGNDGSDMASDFAAAQHVIDETAPDETPIPN